MSKEPKYLQALRLKEEGKSHREIEEILNVKRYRATELLYIGSHRQKYLEKQRKANQKYYSKNKKRINKNRGTKYRENINYHRETRLSTVNGVVYHLHKRKYTNACELCGKGNRRLLYHHWDEKDLNKGMWICLHCHYKAEWAEKGGYAEYQLLKQRIEQGLQDTVTALAKTLRERKDSRDAR